MSDLGDHLPRNKRLESADHLWYWEGSSVSTSNHKLFVRFSLACFFWFTADGTAVADPYYTVTNLGNVDEVNALSMLPYPNSYATLPQSDFASRPGVTGWQGVLNPVQMFFPMQVSDYNSAGTVLGGVPSGGSRGEPYSTLTMGYATVSPNGQWSGFTPLTPGSTYGFGEFVQLSSQSNQILVTDGTVSRLVNPVDGSSTPLNQLVDPSVLAQFPYGLTGQGIDAKGDILAYAGSANGTPDYVMLSPPGVDEAPVPEPTALATLTLAIAAIGLRGWLKKSRRQAPHQDS